MSWHHHHDHRRENSAAIRAMKSRFRAVSDADYERNNDASWHDALLMSWSKR